MFYDNFLKLCNQKGVSPTTAVVEMGFQKSVVTRWKKSIPTDANKLKIAQYFGITVDELINGQKETPALTKKDERDISKRLDQTLRDLEDGQGALMFDGEPLDDITKELLIESLRKDLEMGKRIAKQKFTPRKYQKQDKPEGD